MASESFAKEYLLDCYCRTTTAAGHVSFPTIDSPPNVPIPSFLLAFAVSCERRGRDDKEFEDLYPSTENSKETIVINTNETSQENVDPNIIVAIGGAVVAFVRLVQDIGASPVEIVIYD